MQVHYVYFFVYRNTSKNDLMSLDFSEKLFQALPTCSPQAAGVPAQLVQQPNPCPKCRMPSLASPGTLQARLCIWMGKHQN